MTVENPTTINEREPTPAEYAEAAAWIARLHGPNRTPQVERGLRRWLDADPVHAAAFEATTAGWDVAGRLPRRPFQRLSRWQRMGYRQGFMRSALAVAGVAAIAFGTFFYVQQQRGVSTGIGEQRVLALDDGSRVTLNTDTRVKVQYDEHTRLIELTSGEALFEVAKEAKRPFIVKAGDREVRALGTSFVVRRDAQEIEVTLVEGRIAVSDIPAVADASVRKPAHKLVPGQRLTLTERTPPKVDLPPIDKITAWRRGLVDFENTPLADAVAEMNRYSMTKLVIDDADVAGIPITGVFRAGDATSLAAAVARAYGIQVMQTDNSIRLTRTADATKSE